MADRERYMREAIRLSLESVRNGAGGPFGSVVVKGGKIVGRGYNQVTSANDPTAHAEMMAIREACRALGTFQLTGCEIYTTCEPCPMCLGAIYWARPERIYYANTREDAAKIGFDDRFIYGEMAADISERKIPAVQLLRDEAFTAFAEWEQNPWKKAY